MSIENSIATLAQRLEQARGGTTLFERLQARGIKPHDSSHLLDPNLWERLKTSPPALDTSEGYLEAEQPKPDHRDPKSLLTLEQAAERLNTTPEQVKGFVEDGTLRYVNLGRGRKRPRYRFTETDLDQFIAARTFTQEQLPCRFTHQRNTRASTSSISNSRVVGFMARRAALLAAKPKGSKH